MEDTDQSKIEHLKLVQGVISRMSQNSAQVKTLAVSLVTAVYIFSGLSDDPHWFIGAGGGIAVLFFWYMDARYLRLERCYIKLYEAVVNDSSTVPFDLNYRPYLKEVDSIWRIVRSWSILPFYCLLLFATSLLTTFLL